MKKVSKNTLRGSLALCAISVLSMTPVQAATFEFNYRDRNNNLLMGSYSEEPGLGTVDLDIMNPNNPLENVAGKGGGRPPTLITTIEAPIFELNFRNRTITRGGNPYGTDLEYKEPPIPEPTTILGTLMVTGLWSLRKKKTLCKSKN